LVHLPIIHQVFGAAARDCWLFQQGNFVITLWFLQKKNSVKKNIIFLFQYSLLILYRAVLLRYFAVYAEGEKNTRRGGWIMFSNYRFLFETQNTNDQKQIRQLLKIPFRRVCSGKMNREKREEAGHKQFIQVPSTNRK